MIIEDYASLKNLDDGEPFEVYGVDLTKPYYPVNRYPATRITLQNEPLVTVITKYRISVLGGINRLLHGEVPFSFRNTSVNLMSWIKTSSVTPNISIAAAMRSIERKEHLYDPLPVISKIIFWEPLKDILARQTPIVYTIAVNGNDNFILGGLVYKSYE